MKIHLACYSKLQIIIILYKLKLYIQFGRNGQNSTFFTNEIHILWVAKS